MASLQDGGAPPHMGLEKPALSEGSAHAGQFKPESTLVEITVVPRISTVANKGPPLSGKESNFAPQHLRPLDRNLCSFKGHSNYFRGQSPVY